MHILMLVTLSLPDGSTSEDARWAVKEALINDDSFCGDGGRFGSPLCDWFEIGGRWSGILSESTIGDDFNKALIARFPELTDKWQRRALAAQHLLVFDELWASCGGIGPNLYSRSGWETMGYPDDAMLLSQKLYDDLLSDYVGKDLFHEDEGCEYVDLDHEALAPDFIGRKWLVVVDYHA